MNQWIVGWSCKSNVSVVAIWHWPVSRHGRSVLSLVRAKIGNYMSRSGSIREFNFKLAEAPCFMYSIEPSNRSPWGTHSVYWNGCGAALLVDSNGDTIMVMTWCVGMPSGVLQIECVLAEFNFHLLGPVQETLLWLCVDRENLHRSAVCRDSRVKWIYSGDRIILYREALQLSNLWTEAYHD